MFHVKPQQREEKAMTKEQKELKDLNADLKTLGDLNRTLRNLVELVSINNQMKAIADRLKQLNQTG